MSKFVDRRKFVNSANTLGKDYNGVLMVVDVDDFDSIKTDWGQDASDKAILTITALLKEAVREDDIIACVGNARFVVYATNANLTQGSAVAERIRRSINEAFFQPVPGETKKMSVSIGAVLSAPKQDAERMILLAEACLGTAHKNGRNTVVMKTYFRAEKTSKTSKAA